MPGKASEKYIYLKISQCWLGEQCLADGFLFLFSTSLSLDQKIIAVSFTLPYTVLQQWWLSAPLEMHDQNAVAVTAP